MPCNMPVLSGGVQGRATIDFRAMSPPSLAADTVPASSPSRAWLPPLLIGALAIAGAHLLDETAWRSVRDARVYERDWGRLLRSIGYLPTWLIIAIGLWTHDRPRLGWGWRGGYAVLAPLMGGLAAEVLKLCARRLRPDPDVFGYTFRAFSDQPWHNGGLGLPSSHALVAFAGAAALARLFPRAWPLWYLLAAGCAMTRVMAVAHYFSDVVTAAVVAWFVAEALSRWMLRERRFV